jgi:hypothetical protein
VYVKIGDDMVEMCMFAYNENTHKHHEQCLGPYPLDSYAAIFRPIKMLHDDPDRCGFYFFPYKLLHTWWATYHDGFVTDFDTIVCHISPLPTPSFSFGFLSVNLWL